MTARDRLIRMARDRGGVEAGEVLLDQDWTMTSIAEDLQDRISRELLGLFLFRTSAFRPWRLVLLRPGARRPLGRGTAEAEGFACHVLISGPAPALTSRRARIGVPPVRPGDAVAVSAGLGVDLVHAGGEPAALIESYALRS